MAEIYRKAFEIAVRCARELNGTPELMEAYKEAQKDNRALQSFTDFCLQKAAAEISDNVVNVVRCKDCKHLNVLNRNNIYAHCPKTNTVFLPFELDTRQHFCSLGERREGE